MWKRLKWVLTKNTRGVKLREYHTERLQSYRTALVLAMRRERGAIELFVLAKELAKVEHILDERGEL